jgi:hypothetical protein
MGLSEPRERGVLSFSGRLASLAAGTDSEFMTTVDLSPVSLDHDTLTLELERLRAEERQLSRRRDRLHRRIEFLRGGGASDDATNELLASVEGEERYVSGSRHDVHRRIDLLRAEQLRRKGD